MIKTIIKIRLLQLYRLLKDIGIFRIIFVILLFSFILYVAFLTIKQPVKNPLTTIVSAILLIAVHAGRKDKRFLSITVVNPYFIYVSEYLLIILPLFLICIVSFNWSELGLLAILCIAIPLISFYSDFGKTSSFLKFIVKPFISGSNYTINAKIPITSAYAFEWISGIRRNFLFLVPLYILLVCFSFKPYVASIGMIVFSIIISGFYLYGECREFIELYATGTNEFIFRKIGINLRYLIILYIPVTAISILCQPSTWYFVAGAIIISCFIQILSIIFKYGLFKENSDLSRNSMIGILNIIFILIPFFWPVPIIMGIRYYIKGQNNLKKYFNDYNS